MRRSRARTCGHTHLHDYKRCPSICRGAYLRWNRGDDKPLPSPVRTTRRHCPVRLHCTKIPCSTGCNVQVVLRAFRGRVVRLCSESRACHTDPRWRTIRLRCVHYKCIAGSRHAWAIVIGLCTVYVVGTRRFVVDEPVCLAMGKHWNGLCMRAPACADCTGRSVAPDAAAAIAGAACLDPMQAEEGNRGQLRTETELGRG